MEPTREERVNLSTSRDSTAGDEPEDDRDWLVLDDDTDDDDLPEDAGADGVAGYED
jgi:hypothetical protein